jgi:polysaccharide pyruvyl transferase WcaK-like protein
MTTTILLAGNGTFLNRGCEAISRGTIEILQQTFGSSLRILHASQGHTENGALAGLGVQNMPFFPGFSKYSKSWVAYQLNRFCGTSFTGGYAHLEQAITQADVVLSIGGDNYSLDYGYPEMYVQFDRLVLKHCKPLAYFGVSVGPFSADADYEHKMKSHLSRVNAIFARESASAAYLASIGVSNNVHLIADPAFAMKPVQPDSSRFVLPAGDFIGLNFSTTVGRMLFDAQGAPHGSDLKSTFTSSGQMSNSSAIIQHYAEISAGLMKKFGIALVFIPHVTGGVHCDYKFMNQIADQLDTMGCCRPVVVPDTLTAPEYKWVISKSKLFIGARTHSTIAAFSSGVPTISLAYSIKANGLTRDMYGSDEFCIDGSKVTVENICAISSRLLADEQSFRKLLGDKAKAMSEKALSAGEILKKSVLKLS